LKNFNAQINDFVKKSQARIDAVIKVSAQEVFEEAQRDTTHGGRMRVDTGFLKNSGAISYNGLPTGPSRNEGAIPEAQDIGLGIIKWQPAKTPIWFGWTANYARPREYYDGFVATAAQKWQSIVKARADEYRRRAT